jgi:hypothetical protein
VPVFSVRCTAIARLLTWLCLDSGRLRRLSAQRFLDNLHPGPSLIQDVRRLWLLLLLYFLSALLLHSPLVFSLLDCLTENVCYNCFMLAEGNSVLDEPFLAMLSDQSCLLSIMYNRRLQVSVPVTYLVTFDSSRPDPICLFILLFMTCTRVKEGRAAGIGDVG